MHPCGIAANDGAVERTTSMEMLNIEQFEGLQGAIKEARNDDTPYIGIKDDEIHVQGNPNKTEVTPADYTVYFAFPNNDEYKKRAKTKGDEFIQLSDDKRFAIYKRTIGNVYLTPRRVGAVISTIAMIESFIFKVTDNGEVKELSYEEMQALMYTLNGELSDATYDLVATVLRIPFDEEEFMLPLNTAENAIKIAVNNPSAVNEADLFFGLPLETATEAKPSDSEQTNI